MRLSEKYGRWGIVCGGTIGQGSHSNRLASEGVNVCVVDRYRAGSFTVAMSLPCNRVSSPGLSDCKKTLCINFSHSGSYPKAQILHCNQHIECVFEHGFGSGSSIIKCVFW